MAETGDVPTWEFFETKDAFYAFLGRIEKRLDEQSTALALILEALTPEGCGHDNWVEVTTSGASERKYHCGESGCTAQKTEPW